MKLYFLRHGQTTASRDHVFCGSGMNPTLTEAGQEMAHAFAAAYRSTPWQAVYCSPLQRTVATAQPLCDTIHTKPELRDQLKEIVYGKWEGQTVETITRDYPQDHARWTADPAWNPPTAGENGLAIARRGLEVIEEIRQRFTAGNILIVSHKATIRVLVCSLLGIELSRYRERIACPVGSVTVIEFAAQGPLLHQLADRSHLDERLRSLPGS